MPLNRRFPNAYEIIGGVSKELSVLAFCSRPRTFVFDGWTIVLEQISIGVDKDRLPITVRVVKHYAIQRMMDGYYSVHISCIVK